MSREWALRNLQAIRAAAFLAVLFGLVVAGLLADRWRWDLASNAKTRPVPHSDYPKEL